MSRNSALDTNGLIEERCPHGPILIKIYGPDEAAQLVKTSPGSTQNNAENIEYFVESILFGMKP